MEATNVFASPTGHRSGIGYYTENIIKGCIEQGGDDLDFYIAANLFFTNKPRLLEINGRHNYKFTKFIPGKVWNQLGKKQLLPPIDMIRGGKPDVVVNFDFVRLPVSSRVKTITVIHDLAFVHFPEFIESKNLARLNKFVPMALEKSDRIVAVSEYTKLDIVKSFGVSKDKIDVVTNAVDRTVFHPKVDKSIFSKYDLPSRYLLYVGNIEPRKNIVRIIEAYSRLPDSVTDKYGLVVAGGKGWKDQEILESCNRSTRKDKIHFPGYVDSNDLASLYSHAELFLFPSLYEGFGLPILESMACDTPVITGKNSSLPEVGGSAAYFVDEKNIVSISKGIEEIINKKNVKDRLVSAGREQAKKFNWEKSADNMINSINKALG